jgi:hypothetical protein
MDAIRLMSPTPIQGEVIAHAKEFHGEGGSPPIESNDSVSISGHGHPPEETHEGSHGGILHDAMKTAHVGGAIAHSAEATGILADIGLAGGVASGIYFGIEGVKDLKEAVANHDVMGELKASGHLALAGEAAVEATMETASIFTHTSAAAGLMGPAVAALAHSHALHMAAATLGVVHGAVEVVLGGKEVYDGVKAHDKKKMLTGALLMGVGSAIAGVAMGGGLPAGIALGAFFLPYLAVKNSQAIKNTAVKAVDRMKSAYHRVSESLLGEKPGPPNAGVSKKSGADNSA